MICHYISWIFAALNPGYMGCVWVEVQVVISSDSLNIIFAGTPDFAAVALRALLNSSHTIKAVYTQPDRPAGRGRQLTPSPVKQLALAHDLPVYQPLTLKDAAEQKKLADLQADIMVVVAYGLLLPLPVLQAPRLGCINIHASLLPRWRGAAPIQRAIQAGDEKSGVIIMQMDEGLDTGAMLYRVECPIQPDDTSQTLHDRLATLGADAMLKTLSQLAQGTANPEQQNHALATYAHKIKKEEAALHWQLSAVELERQVRAFNPWPVAYTTCRDQVLRVWQATTLHTESKETSVPGTIIHASSQGIDVATGSGVLRLQKLQLPGGKVLSAADILNARQHDFAVGTILG
jgi:methionyl-tRNA formyltransferase